MTMTSYMDLGFRVSPIPMFKHGNSSMKFFIVTEERKS